MNLEKEIQSFVDLGSMPCACWSTARPEVSQPHGRSGATLQNLNFSPHVLLCKLLCSLQLNKSLMLTTAAPRQARSAACQGAALRTSPSEPGLLWEVMAIKSHRDALRVTLPIFSVPCTCCAACPWTWALLASEIRMDRNLSQVLTINYNTTIAITVMVYNYVTTRMSLSLHSE